MKTITIRELHERTGKWVRGAAELGEIAVTDHGRKIAKLVPVTEDAEVPYFAVREPSPAFARLQRSGKLRGGADSTIGISEDRDR